MTTLDYKKILLYFFQKLKMVYFEFIYFFDLPPLHSYKIIDVSYNLKYQEMILIKNHWILTLIRPSRFIRIKLNTQDYKPTRGLSNCLASNDTYRWFSNLKAVGIKHRVQWFIYFRIFYICYGVLYRTLQSNMAR